ncbi:MAG: NADH-quinone oxidoreductase subunit I [bacterium]|nr:NADH-quinone oxidoreductase subunit I [bacterium]
MKETLRTSMVGMGITGKYLKPGTETTRLYPEEPPLVFERTRGRMDVAVDKCIACNLCAKACPVACITLESEAKLQGKGKRPARFEIKFSRCMFCGLCVEACPTAAIFHTGKSDFSAYRLQDLDSDLGGGFYTDEERRLAAMETAAPPLASPG